MIIRPIGGGGQGDMQEADYVSGGLLTVAHGGFNASDAAGARASIDAQESNTRLTALAGLSSTGPVVLTSSSAATNRTLTGTSNRISISGGTTFDVGSDVGLINATRTYTGEKTFDAFKANAIAVNASTAITIDGVITDGHYITIPEQSNPSTPAANKTIFFAKDVGGRAKLHVIDDAGNVKVAARSPAENYAVSMIRNQGFFITQAAVPAAELMCLPINTVQAGTGSNTINIDIPGYGIKIRSATTSGNSRGYSSTNAVTALAALPYFFFRISLEHTTSIRFFCGITSLASTVMTDSDNPNGEYVGFQFSTNRSDTELQAVCGNSSVNQNVTTTGVGTAQFDAATEDILCVGIVNSTSSVSLYVYDMDGTQLGSTVNFTTNLPTSTTPLWLFMAVETLTTGARGFYFYKAGVTNNGFRLTSLPG